MKIKMISDHKRRFDRGGTYFGYFQMLASSTILIRVFDIKTWWIYVLNFIVIMSVRYLMGYVDEKKKILQNEQAGYNRENQAIQQILNDLNTIKNTLYEKDLLVDGNGRTDPSNQSTRYGSLAPKTRTISNKMEIFAQDFFGALGDTRTVEEISREIRDSRIEDKGDGGPVSTNREDTKK